MVAMPALAADWGSGDTGGASYSDHTHTKRFNFFRSDEDNTPTKANGNGHVARSYSMKSYVNLNGTTSIATALDGIAEPKVRLYDPAKLRLSWFHEFPAGAGLSNLGNTCFLNSVLQCLTYTAPLAHFLTRDGHRNSCELNKPKPNGLKEFCMLCALQGHLERCHKIQGAFKPLFILQNLKSIARCLTWGQQEDAHEFLRYVVDSMQKSCLNGRNGLDRHSKETTFVHQMFGGYLRSQVKCLKCHHASNTYDPFLDLSVDIKECDSVQQGLSRFVSPEMLDIENAYKCERCKVKVRAEKRFTVHRSSNVLTIHLKRFDMNRMLGAKVSRHIRFPVTLDIRPYMSRSQGEPMEYQLYAVLVHSGLSCNSGHYYCYVKAPNRQWYCMNDSVVSQVSQKTVMDAEAYILFYVAVKKSHSNKNAPRTITRAEMMNGSGDSAPRRDIIGPLLPSAQEVNKKTTSLPGHHKFQLHLKKPTKSLDGIVKLSNPERKPVTFGSKSPAGTRMEVSSLVPYKEADEEEESSETNLGVVEKQTESSTSANGPVTSPGKPKLTLREYVARQENKSPDSNGISTLPLSKTVTNGANDKPSVSSSTVNGHGLTKFTPRAVKIGTAATGLGETEQKSLSDSSNGGLSSATTNGVSSSLVDSKSLLLQKSQVCHKCSLKQCYCDMTTNGNPQMNGQKNTTLHSEASITQSPEKSGTSDHADNVPAVNGTVHESKVNGSVSSSYGSEEKQSNGHRSNGHSLNGTNSEDNVKSNRKVASSPADRSPSPRRRVHTPSSRKPSHSPSPRRRSRSPTRRRRSRSTRRDSRSPRRRSRSPVRYRRYSRSPYRRTYGRRSPSPRRHKGQSRSPDPRRRRSRSRSKVAKFFKHRHKSSRHNTRSRSRSRTDSRDRKYYDRHYNNYKYNHSESRRDRESRHDRSSHHTPHKHSSGDRKRRSSSSDRETPSKKKRRSDSGSRAADRDEKREEREQLIRSGDPTDDDSYSCKWVEVTKDKLHNKKVEKSRSTWYTNGDQEHHHSHKSESKHKGIKCLEKFSVFANKHMKKDH